MNKVKIVAHCLVKNEEKFIWYSLNSVLPYVDKIMVWDTGSTDNTVQIIKSIKSPKIDYKQAGTVDINSFTKIRNTMLKETEKSFTWLLLLDGDEVWSDDAIKVATSFANANSKLESIVVRTHNLVGDIYHRSPELFGSYRLAGKTGHLNLRFLNLKTIPGLHVDLPHGQQGYFDKNKKLVQDRGQSKIKFLDLYYHHATHLLRSSSITKDAKVPKRKQKYKYILGSTIPKTQIPEIFFANHPEIVPTVTSKAPFFYYPKAFFYTFPRLAKKLLFPLKSGY